MLCMSFIYIYIYMYHRLRFCAGSFRSFPSQVLCPSLPLRPSLLIYYIADPKIDHHPYSCGNSIIPPPPSPPSHPPPHVPPSLFLLLSIPILLQPNPTTPSSRVMQARLSNLQPTSSRRRHRGGTTTTTDNGWRQRARF